MAKVLAGRQISMSPAEMILRVRGFIAIEFYHRRGERAISKSLPNASEGFAIRRTLQRVRLAESGEKSYPNSGWALKLAATCICRRMRSAGK